MAWQPEVGASSNRATDYRDFVTKLVQMMCSQHVATVAINNQGTGGTYAVGDILTLTDASAHLDARFEVTGVTAGQIDTLRIDSSGAFAQQAASATVSAGGSGYQVGDILQVQGGTFRVPAKFKVATLSGSAVATVTLFEGGGVYSSTPSNPAATLGVGSEDPQTYAGDDACTLTVTYTPLITPLTNVAVTGGGGTGATVDITLAESGWAVATTDKNDYSLNSVTDEKEVVLVGDATGFTNKPYFGMRTGTATVSLNTRYAVQFTGFIAYNPSLPFGSQVQLSPGAATNVFTDSGSYLIFPQNLDNEVDFWISVDDVRTCGAINSNPSASTDDGRYEQWYAGYGDRAQTETEDPYPMVIFASGRDHDVDPTVSQGTITSFAECRNVGGSGPMWLYFPDVPSWIDTLNNGGGSTVPGPDMSFPFGELFRNITGGNVEYITIETTVQFNDQVFKRDRSAPNRILRPVPGTVDKLYRWPIIPGRRVASDVDETTDHVKLALRGCFAVFNDDGTGTRIANLSEDYISEGTAPASDVRYRIFHNWDLTERYQYICIHEDV